MIEYSPVEIEENAAVMEVLEQPRYYLAPALFIRDYDMLVVNEQEWDEQDVDGLVDRLYRADGHVEVTLQNPQGYLETFHVLSLMVHPGMAGARR